MWQERVKAIKFDSGTPSFFTPDGKLHPGVKKKVKWEFFELCFDIEPWRAKAILEGSSCT